MGLLAKPSPEEEVVLLEPSSSGSKLSSFKSTKKPQNEIPGIHETATNRNKSNTAPDLDTNTTSLTIAD
jgi:hypothetical protein